MVYLRCRKICLIFILIKQWNTFCFQVEYTEVDVKLANLTDDEISDDEIMRTSSRISPVPTPMETDEQRDVEEEEEEEDVPEGRFHVLCSTS